MLVWIDVTLDCFEDILRNFIVLDFVETILILRNIFVKIYVLLGHLMNLYLYVFYLLLGWYSGCLWFSYFLPEPWKLYQLLFYE